MWTFDGGFDSHTFCGCYRDKSKGNDPCVKNMDCKYCNSLSSEQKAHLSTSSYQDKKKKHELKAIMQESDSTLVEPSSVTVIGILFQTLGNPAVHQQNSVESDRSVKTKKQAGMSVSKALEGNHWLVQFQIVYVPLAVCSPK